MINNTQDDTHSECVNDEAALVKTVDAAQISSLLFNKIQLMYVSYIQRQTALTDYGQCVLMLLVYNR